MLNRAGPSTRSLWNWLTWRCMPDIRGISWFSFLLLSVNLPEKGPGNNNNGGACFAPCFPLPCRTRNQGKVFSFVDAVHEEGREAHRGHVYGNQIAGTSNRVHSIDPSGLSTVLFRDWDNAFQPEG